MMTHLAQGASSNDDLNILIQAHSRSSSTWQAYVTAYFPGLPELLSALVFMIKMATIFLLSAANRTLGQRCLHVPAHSTIEVQVMEIKENRVSDHNLAPGRSGKKPKTCISNLYFLSTDDKCSFNRTAPLATLKSHNNLN